MTKPQRKALEHVVSMSKGWPVGIPLPKAMAHRLVAAGLAEWAPPFWCYPRPVFTVRVTGAGTAALLYG